MDLHFSCFLCTLGVGELGDDRNQEGHCCSTVINSVLMSCVNDMLMSCIGLHNSKIFCTFTHVKQLKNYLYGDKNLSKGH